MPLSYGPVSKLSISLTKIDADALTDELRSKLAVGVNSRILAGLKVVVEEEEAAAPMAAPIAEDSPVSAANIGDEAA